MCTVFPEYADFPNSENGAIRKKMAIKWRVNLVIQSIQFFIAKEISIVAFLQI
jgi:hypothetical protein